MDIFHEDFRTEPYWRAEPGAGSQPKGPLPGKADAIVVGAGYTGLSAAIALARGGCEVLVLDSGDAGQGCSTRNGGQVSMGIKPDLAELAPVHGEEAARAILRVGHQALEFLRETVRTEAIDCDWQDCGRFSGAHSPRAYERMARKIASQPAGLEVEAHLVPRSGQHREIGTDRYHGGVVYPTHASVDPARLHAGLLRIAREAGAVIMPHCPVTGIERDAAGSRVHTPQGSVSAPRILVATNGYTGAATPDLRRRVIPIGSYIIATEELKPEVAQRLIPNNRMITDSRHVVFYYRLSPDRRRMIFGGRVALFESDDRRTAPRLHAEMCDLFPELVTTRITHAWHGKVAFTFDHLPHVGQHDGIDYAMGYCGSGISMSVYLGNRAGLRMLGRAEGRTPLDDLPFPTRPFYGGRPWFLAPAILWYRLLDRFG